MLADAFAPLTERDLFNLPRFRMAIRTELDGETRILTTDVLREPRASARPLPSGGAATSATVTTRAKCAMDEPVVVRDAVRNAVRNNREVSKVTLSATARRAQRGPSRKRDTLRYLRAGAIWTALPVRDRARSGPQLLRNGRRALAGTVPRGHRAEARAMIATGVSELAPVVGTSAACAALSSCCGRPNIAGPVVGGFPGEIKAGEEFGLFLASASPRVVTGGVSRVGAMWRVDTDGAVLTPFACHIHPFVMCAVAP